MHGPRLFSRTHLLALAALMLLPACSPRQPIPSDPPEVRTEASVRGARKPAPPAKTTAPAPVTSDPSDVVVAEAKDPAPQAKAAEAKPAAAKAAEAKPADAKESAKQEPAKQEEAKADAPKQDEAKPAGQSETKQAETKQAEAKQAEAKPGDAASAQEAGQGSGQAASQEQAKAPAPKPEPSAAAKADAEAQAAKAEPVAGPQAPRVPVVQIASFTTEKNAEAAVAWLKEKGYAQARIVRVEQGGTAFHRVQAGPFLDPAAAREALEKLKADWPQAFIPAD